MSEEGEMCPECKKGTMQIKRVEDCSCHINPPCSACVNAPLVCDSCGYRETVEHMNGLVARVNPQGTWTSWKRRELDKTKIDWHSQTDTHFTMKKVGVYPPGTTIQQVEEKVKGTFGGRFEYFQDGVFSYVAYTD